MIYCLAFLQLHVMSPILSCLVMASTVIAASKVARQPLEAPHEKGTYVPFPFGKGAGWAMLLPLRWQFCLCRGKGLCVKLHGPTSRLGSGSEDFCWSHPLLRPLLSSHPAQIQGNASEGNLTGHRRCIAASGCMRLALEMPCGILTTAWQYVCTTCAKPNRIRP